MIYATTKFKKGDRVQQTKAWDDHCKLDTKAKRPRTGTVVGFSRSRKLVWIIADGTKTRVVWHPDFWAVVPQPIEAAYFKPVHFKDDGCTVTEAEAVKPYRVTYGPVIVTEPLIPNSNGWFDRVIALFKKILLTEYHFWE